jgi:hypothetical protein
MERLENLTMEQLEVASKVSEMDGYQETQSIENIPVGICSAHSVIIKVDDNLTPSFALIKFERKNAQGEEVKLFFEAVKLDVLHVTTGRSYNGIYAKITPELKTALSKPENYTEELAFDSQAYIDSAKRNRTILKFESMSK